jgi:predicted membrane protein
MAKNILNETFSEPLNDATTARVEIHAGDGNLTIDRLVASEPALATGNLQYLENQGKPVKTLVAKNGQATLTLKGSRAGQPWFHLPWSTCNGATDWQIHLNPTVSSDITAHSDGGNVRLDLAGMAITRVMVDTGGGNIDLILPDNATNLDVTARTGAGNVAIEIGDRITGSTIVNANSGAGNVTVRIPNGTVVCVHTTTGLGKVIVDPQFRQIDKHTYQSPDFEHASNKVEITAGSGAGNVIVETR